MIHGSVRFVHAANWVFAAMLAFLFVSQWDEGVPVSVDAVVSVGEWDEATPARELHSGIEEFAIDHEISVAKLAVDFDDQYTSRILYGVAGDASDAAIETGEAFPDFSHSVSTEVRPYAELGDQTVVGSYYVFGDPAKARELAAHLNSQGLMAQVNEMTWDQLLLRVGKPLATPLGMMVLVAMTLVGAAVLMGVRSYGIGRLHGRSYGSLLMMDFRKMAGAWTVSGAAVLAGALCALWFYNGLAAGGAYVTVALIVGLILSAATVFAHAAMVLLLLKVDVVSAVKGEIPSRTASVITYTLRLVVVASAVLLVGDAVFLGADAAKRAQLHEDYEALGDMSTIAVNRPSSMDMEDAYIEQIGAWLREEDRSGELLVVGEDSAVDQTVLYVNSAFLEDQPLELADGTELTADDVTDEMVAMIPSGLWPQREEIIDELTALGELRFQPEAYEGASYHVVEGAADLEVFTYGPETERSQMISANTGDQSYAKNPVVVAYPSEIGALSDFTYANFVTDGAALFLDPATVTAALDDDPDLQDAVLSMTPVVDKVEAQYGETVAEFRLALFNALAASLVVVITGIGAVLIYARRNAQLIFARHISGWRFSAVHRTLLAIEAGVLVILVGYTPYQVWSTNRSEMAVYERAGVDAPFEPALMTAAQWSAVLLLAVVAVGGLLLALNRSHRRVVRHGAGEA